MMASSTVFSARRRPTPGDSDDTDMSTPRSAPGKRIPSSEWEKKRPIITRLYQEEKRPLKEVMEILQREHGFTATVKMYKSRIWKWGLDKKLKSDEVLAILIIKTERDAQGKASEFTIRGQKVDLDNINRYIRRNPGLVARFRAGELPNVNTHIEVNCRTPSPAPSPSLPPPPETLRVEQVLGLFRNYVDASFSSGAWKHEHNVYCVSRKSRDQGEELFERVITLFSLVNRSMMRYDDVSITQVLSPAFESLRVLIGSESPIFVVRTICLVWYLNRHHQKDLTKLVMSYVAGMVPVILGQNNPMSRIWQILGSQEFSEFYELATRLYASLVPDLEERIGPANLLTTTLYGDHIDCLVSNNKEAESLEVATRYRAKMDATGKRHSWLSEIAITQTTIQCTVKSAEGRNDEAIQCLQNLKEYDMDDDQQAVVDIQLGNYSYRMGDLSSAVHWYREAMRLLGTPDGDERLLETCLANLETALHKQGDLEEARRLHHYRLGRLSAFAKDSSTFASLPYPMDKTNDQPEVSTALLSPLDGSSCSGQQTPDWLWGQSDAVPNGRPLISLT
ncbi:Clr5 domain-containing protein [Fusarium keratoplasticum]|nr:Clr5 domain-containing protein [Fusarium keratoplasticum]